MNPGSVPRRRVLQAVAGGVLVAPLGVVPWRARAASSPLARVRPGEPGWPSDEAWQRLGQQVEGALIKVQTPLDACMATPTSAACAQLFKAVKNPYFTGDDVALTQTLGWVDAWTSKPSVYAMAARTTRDVVAAVDFARQNRLRLVVKGGGHSYQGTSNCADSLLVWTRRMNGVQMHDSFVPAGCDAVPRRAVSMGAGALWAHAYDAVTTQAGGYVQGGGCTTVGVAGLVQSGGFGSFSKRYGTAAGSLLEAEIVTADGAVRLANACTNPELFWGLKGGGGGSLGVVTRVTLRVHDLPGEFGAVNMSVKALSPQAYRRLIGLMVEHYAKNLMNPHWGEQIRVRPDNVLRVSMVFQALNRGQAQMAWQPFVDAVASAPADFWFESAPFIASLSAREFWSATTFKKLAGVLATDDRPGAPKTNVFWPGDQGQAGQFLHGYDSAWLPASLLRDDRRDALCDALFAASRHTGIGLHTNKGLAGAPAEAIAAARDTATNPLMLDAFALAIMGAEEQPAYPGVAGHEPDVARGRLRAQAIARAVAELRRVAPNGGAYVSESNYFEPDFQRQYWGTNYPRLQAVKARYDPDGLFFVHNGVGSEGWSTDGFNRTA
ncbi:FAD-binding oxidoreductase [Variovorax sp. dw_954]|uniref:FAD-dependent oxidoreductase n=1 Tax=Variovorax sp. dw_954 TaxID=2720078 RepID=UPI001BD5DEE7|nr:FAD-binding oxidoreductase [Variovorax sp. dw_954]